MVDAQHQQVVPGHLVVSGPVAVVPPPPGHATGRRAAMAVGGGARMVVLLADPPKEVFQPGHEEGPAVGGPGDLGGVAEDGGLQLGPAGCGIRDSIKTYVNNPRWEVLVINLILNTISILVSNDHKLT